DGVQHAAASLAKRGLRKGDVVAICSANCPDYAIAFHAVALIGGIVTTINPIYTAEEIEKQMQDADAKYLVTAPRFLENARNDDVRETFVFGQPSFDSLLQADGEVPHVAIDPRNDVIALPYSSGTTGLPKGVMLTHRNLAANVLQCQAVFQIREDDVVLGV